MTRSVFYISMFCYILCIFLSPFIRWVYILFSTQVSRGARLQEGAPGSKWSVEEQSEWAESEITICRKRIAEADPSAAQIVKAAKTSKNADRVASLDIIHMSGSDQNHHRIRYYIFVAFDCSMVEAMLQHVIFFYGNSCLL